MQIPSKYLEKKKEHKVSASSATRIGVQNLNSDILPKQLVNWLLTL